MADLFGQEPRCPLWSLSPVRNRRWTSSFAKSRSLYGFQTEYCVAPCKYRTESHALLLDTVNAGWNQPGYRE